jgi:ribosomal protein S18 acetylase RimI-like enzyme
MKNKSIILKIILPVAIGLLVGKFVTPLFGVESPWTSIAISTVITISLFIIIESITSKLTTGRTSTVSMGQIKNLHKVKRHEIWQATTVLADAFKEDPMFKTLFGDAVKNSHKYTLVAKFMIRYCYKYGNVYASSEKFEGIMAITQDEYAYMTLWRMIRSGSIFPFLSIGFKSFMKVASSLSPIDVARKKHMKNKSFAYLQIIGVAKEHQGKGHGGKLVKEFITMTDKVNIPIYLETETEINVKFYEKYGFKTLEQINLPIINQPMWVMIRDSKKSSSK